MAAARTPALLQPELRVGPTGRRAARPVGMASEAGSSRGKGAGAGPLPSAGLQEAWAGGELATQPLWTPRSPECSPGGCAPASAASRPLAAVGAGTLPPPPPCGKRVVPAELGTGDGQGFIPSPPRPQGLWGLRSQRQAGQSLGAAEPWPLALLTYPASLPVGAGLPPLCLVPGPVRVCRGLGATGEARELQADCPGPARPSRTLPQDLVSTPHWGWEVGCHLSPWSGSDRPGVQGTPSSSPPGVGVGGRTQNVCSLETVRGSRCGWAFAWRVLVFCAL